MRISDWSSDVCSSDLGLSEICQFADRCWPTNGARRQMTQPWWMPDRHQDRRHGLLARTAVKAALRAGFAVEGFVEVEAAVLQVSPGTETHMRAFATQAVSLDGSAAPPYHHTPPAFAT